MFQLRLAANSSGLLTTKQSIESFDIDGSCDNAGYQPCSSRMLASHKVYVDSFRSIYPINTGISNSSAVATGRYPEDTYYGGNPWYLCTLAAAELLYDAAAQFRRQGQLTVDATSLAFFQQIYPAAKVSVSETPAGFQSDSETGWHIQSTQWLWTGWALGYVTLRRTQLGQSLLVLRPRQRRTARLDLQRHPRSHDHLCRW